MNLFSPKISNFIDLNLYNDFQYTVFNSLIEKKNNQIQSKDVVSNDYTINSIIYDFKQMNYDILKTYYNDIIYRNSVYSNLPKLLIYLYDNPYFVDYVYSSLYEYIYYYITLQSDTYKSYIKFCQFIPKYINYLYLNNYCSLDIAIKLINYGFKHSVPYHQYISYENIFRFCHYDIVSKTILEHKQFFIEIFCYDIEDSNNVSRLFELLDELESNKNNNWKLIELLLNEKIIFEFSEKITINISNSKTLYQLLDYLYYRESFNIDTFINYIFSSPHFISLFNTNQLHSIIDDYVYRLLNKKSSSVLYLIRHKLFRIKHLKYYLELDNYDDYEEKYLYESYNNVIDHIFIEIVKNKLFTQNELISINANNRKYEYKFRFLNCIKYSSYDIIEIGIIRKYFGFDFV